MNSTASGSFTVVNSRKLMCYRFSRLTCMQRKYEDGEQGLKHSSRQVWIEILRKQVFVTPCGLLQEERSSDPAR